MNRISFLDELMKLGCGSTLFKLADDGEVNTVDIPHGMMSSDPMPEAITPRPDDAASRVSVNSIAPSSVSVGRQGPITDARNPIDREKYNRAYKDRR